MTLARQLTLAMLLVVMFAFGVRNVMTVFEMRDYLNKQLQSHARDSARSLGLSISLHLADGDPLFSESIVDAMFDSGDYARIEIRDLKGQIQLRRERSVAPAAIPQWFINLVPLQAPTASADLTTGWKRTGLVLVKSHPGYAYQQLWRSAQRSLWTALGFVLIALLIFSALLRVLLRPLREIEHQAMAVAQRRFPSIEHLPGGRELRRVAEAMNFMTHSVQKIIEDQAEQARQLSEEIYIDTLTGVRNRHATEMDIAQLVREGVNEPTGALLLVAVNGLDELNRRCGYETGDDLIRQAATIIVQRTAGQRSSVGRYGGGLFAITLTDVTRDAVEELAQGLIEGLHVLRLDDNATVAANVGIAFHGAAESAGALIAQCEAALRNAQQNGPGLWHSWHAAETAAVDALHDEAQWAKMLQTLVAKRDVILEAQPVQNTDGEILHLEILARYKNEERGLIPAAKFIPMAARLGLSAALDIIIVEKALDHMSVRFQSQECYAINLSPGAVLDPDFIRWLQRRLENEPVERRQRVAFEVTEHFAASRRKELCQLIDAVAPLGVRVGVDHCGAGDVSMSALRELRLSYVKLYGALTQGIDTDRDKYKLVCSLVSIGHGLGLKMVAEFIENEAELAAVKTAGFDALQGYFIGLPGPLQ